MDSQKSRFVKDDKPQTQKIKVERQSVRGQFRSEKFANSLPFICSRCRAQLSVEQMRKNVDGRCPACAGKVLTKITDRKQTSGKIRRPAGLQRVVEE